MRKPTGAAIAKFREFHRKGPRKIGEFHRELAIPTHAILLGDAMHVLYRSDKVDPETLAQPARPINYIHEHDSLGVQTYAPVYRHRRRSGEVEPVPDFIRTAAGLVLLGTCLGLKYRLPNGTELELEGDGRPLSELYTTPSGRALLVIAGKRDLEFMIWGGALGVEDRGIVG